MLTKLTLADLSAILGVASARSMLVSHDDAAESIGTSLLTSELERRFYAMSPVAQSELVAMVWLGRSDGFGRNWASLLQQAEGAIDSGTAVKAILGEVALDEYLRSALQRMPTQRLARGGVDVPPR